MEHPKPRLVVDGDTRRSKEANQVLAEFAAMTEKMTTTIDYMSGFIVIGFDDQGHVYSAMYLGEMFPIPSPLLPSIAEKAVTTRVYE